MAKQQKSEQPIIHPNIGMPIKHLTNAKALNHAFMQHRWHMQQQSMNGMASGGMPQAPSMSPQPPQQQMSIDPSGQSVDQPSGGWAPPDRTDMLFNKNTSPQVKAPAGIVAVNPKTGERLIHRGGKWRPIK